MIYLNNFVALSCLGATDEESADSLQLNRSRYLIQNSEYLLNNESSVLGKLTFIGDTTENESCRNLILLPIRHDSMRGSGICKILAWMQRKCECFHGIIFQNLFFMTH